MKRYSEKPSSIDNNSLEVVIQRLLEETLQDVYDCVSLLTNGNYSTMFKREHLRDQLTLRAMLLEDGKHTVTKALPSLGEWLDNLLKGKLSVVPSDFRRQTIGLTGCVVSHGHLQTAGRDPILVFDGDPCLSEDLYLESLAECANKATIARAWNLDPRWYTNSICDGTYDFDKDVRSQVKQYIDVPQLLRCVWPVLLYDVCRPWVESPTEPLTSGEEMHVRATVSAGIPFTHKEGAREYTTAITVLTRCLRTLCYMFYKLRTQWTKESEERKLNDFLAVESALKRQTIFPKSIILEYAREYAMAALGGVIIDPFIRREIDKLFRWRQHCLRRLQTA